MLYNEAVSMVRGKRNATKRKIGNNTTAEIMGDGSVGIMLHSTYVVKIHPDNTYTLNSGGWRTSTTKDRINKYTNAGLYQKDWVWYLRDGTEFYDGYILSQ